MMGRQVHPHTRLGIDLKEQTFSPLRLTSRSSSQTSKIVASFPPACRESMAWRIRDVVSRKYYADFITI